VPADEFAARIGEILDCHGAFGAALGKHICQIIVATMAMVI
jgi:hypothetical protein